MDSSLTQDSALSSSDALLSDRLSMPTDLQKDMPVCVLVHGFSASSFELNAFEFERSSETSYERDKHLLNLNQNMKISPQMKILKTEIMN